MSEVTQTALDVGEIPRTVDAEPRARIRKRIGLVVGLGALALGVIGGGLLWTEHSAPAAQAVPPPRHWSQ